MKQKFKNNLIIIYSCIFILFVFPSLVKAQCERLVWADEFNGTTVDQTKWQFGYGNTGGLHYYTDREENATISDGTLKIIAREESYMGFDYTSALLFIKNKFGWRYGRMEASIKLPGTPGFVPAFWMMPSDDIYGWWPNSGEIDIMEYVTTLPDTIHGTIHTQYYNLFGVPELPQGGTTYIPDAETAFHVYAVEWTEDKIDFLVDDNIYFTFNNQNSGYEKWPFDHPFYIILNLAIGGGWAGPPNQNTVFPQIMEVDYVRVYQEVDDIIISGDDFPQYNNEGVIYSVPDIDEATTYWSLPGNANIISGQNSHQIIVDWDCFGGDIIAEVVSGSCSKTVNYPVKVSSNFLANPGFEKGVKYWMSRVSHLVTASTELTTEEAHSGNFALDINVQTLGSNTWDIQVSQQDLVIESGKQYEFSFWAKADVGNRQINAVIINTNNYSVYAGEIYTLTTNWVQYTLQFTANETATIALNMDMGFTTGRYYLDDFVFTTPELYNQNQLINGDFTDGSNGWNLTTLGGAQATGTVVNGEYAVSIVSGGNYSWDVHLGQENLLIENGKDYVVSFDAYSEAPRAIYAIVGKNADPWTVYCGTQEISLIADKQTYTFSFLMNDITDPQARLGFDVGASSTDVYFDNICIAEESTVQGYTMEQIRNNLLINPPNSGDSSIRELTILALDEILINDSAQTAQSVINFYNLMMEKVASEINDSRNTDVSVWTMYNHGYVIKTPQIVFAFDLLDGYSSWSTYLPTELVNQIQVLFISHNHADHYDQSIAASVIQNGGFVVVPTENSYMGNVPMAAGDTLTISGLKIKAHSGLHSTPMRIYEVTLPGGLNFLHTGDNQTSETLPEIDSLDILLLNAWVNESGSASAVIGMHNCISILEPSIIIPGHIQEMGHAYMPGNPTSRAIYEWAFEVDNVPVSSEIKVMTWGERYLVPQELIGIIENNKIIYTNGSFVLYDNSPNPFRRSTKIEYNLRKTANVILKVYDVHGQEISTLINEIQGRGHKSVIWDTCDEPGGELSSGIYFYTLQVNNDLECNKMVLID